MISKLDVVVTFEGMKGLREFTVVGKDGFGSETPEAMIVMDRGTVTATSGGTDFKDIDEERNEILPPNLEVLHKTYFHAQKSFLILYARAGSFNITLVTEPWHD